MVRAMKPTSRKRRVLRRFSLVFAVCFAAYAIAATFNPSLLSVPAKDLVGEAGLTFRVGTVHGSINGSPVIYDAYREVLGRDARTRMLQANCIVQAWFATMRRPFHQTSTPQTDVCHPVIQQTPLGGCFQRPYRYADLTKVDTNEKESSCPPCFPLPWCLSSSASCFSFSVPGILCPRKSGNKWTSCRDNCSCSMA